MLGSSVILSTLAVISAQYAAAQGSGSGALAEPPDGQFIFGFWPQADPGYQVTPAQLNERAGFDIPIFQLAQDIPLTPYNFVTGAGGPAPEAYIAATGTSANIFLTVYPNQGFAAVNSSQLLSLALQIRTYQGSNRTVFLRYAPEMNGNWMVYGLQPVEFIESWIMMYDIIKSEAPDTVIVWSPNTGYSYPFGATLANVPNAADRAALDTNGDGRLTSSDNAYSPFYPGDEYVDWNGVSMYYKGPDFVNKNQDEVPGYFYDVIHGLDPYGQGYGNADWYEAYCESKPTKACVVSESGAAYHTLPNLVAAGPNNQVQLQQAWWRDGPLNQSLLDTHPRLKMYIQFEFIKNESDGGVLDTRDYRLLNNSAVLSAFLSDFASYSTRYEFATATTTAPPNASAFEITPSGPVITATVTVNQTSMITATYTQFYSGPFENYSEIATANPLASPTGTLSGSGNAGLIAGAKATSPSLYGAASRSVNTNSLVGVGGALLAVFAAALML